MRLKYIKDISMFNYKPRAIFFSLPVCVFLCDDSLLNVSDDLSDVTRPRSNLSTIGTQAGDFGAKRRSGHLKGEHKL